MLTTTPTATSAPPAAGTVARRLVFVHDNPAGLGGSQASMLLEARTLAQAGWEVLVVHGRAEPLPAAVAGVFTRQLAAPALFGTHPSRAMAAALRRLGRFLDAEHPDAAHLHLWSNPLLLAFVQRRLPTFVTCHVPVCPNGARFQYGPGRLCERRVGVGCLTTGHRRLGCGTMANEVPFGPVAFAASLGYAQSTLALLARCDGVVAPSTWQRRMLIQDGVPAERIRVIPPPIASASSRARAADGDVPVVLGAGRLMVLKGFDHLLRASARVTVPHEVHIAGDGPHLPRLRAVAASAGIADRVRFLGPLSPADLDAAVDAATVVAMPSVWPETFGMIGPEALLRGTPVVAYAGGGIQDWATSAFGALPVALGDVDALAHALTAVLDTPQAHAVTADQHAALSDLVSPERHVELLTDLYASARPR